MNKTDEDYVKEDIRNLVLAIRDVYRFARDVRGLSHDSVYELKQSLEIVERLVDES